MGNLTLTQKKAIEALREHGGQGVIDKNGHILAQGEILGQSPHLPYSAVTWLRLMTLGLIVPDGPNRVKIGIPA